MPTPPTRFDRELVHAVVIDEDGFLFEAEDLEAWADSFEDDSDFVDDDEDAPNPASVLLVTGTAVPRSQSAEVADFHRVYEPYEPSDVLTEYDVLLVSPADVLEIFARVRAAAEAFNVHALGHAEVSETVTT